MVPVKAVKWGWGWREEEVTLEIPPPNGRTGKEFAALHSDWLLVNCQQDKLGPFFKLHMNCIPGKFSMY